MSVPAFVPITPYADLPFAIAYMGQRVGTDAWDAASDTLRGKALAMATLHMDGLSYSGFKNDFSSPREFPRNGDTTGIPYEVACACCEEALALLNGKTLEAIEDDAMVSSEQIGDVSTAYGGPTPIELVGQHGGFLSPVSLRLMAPWMRDDDSFFVDRV